MSTTYLRKTDVDHTPRDSAALTVHNDGPSDALQTLSSETAQAVMRALGDGPKPLSEIATAVDTSLQNAQYHVERLADAGLVEPVDRWYSSKGREMSIYALTAEEIVIQFGEDGE